MNNVEMKELFCKPTDERALLSYCLKDMDSFYDLVSKMDSGDFLHVHHSTLFTLFGALAQQDIAKFDLPMVVNTAQQMFAGLDSLGGLEYLQSINEMRVDKGNYDIYLQNVLESSTKYKLYYTMYDDLNKIQENAKDGLSSEDLIGSIERKVLDLSTESKSIREPRNMADGLRELMEQRLANPVVQMGLPTGFPILDKQIDGLVPTTLNIISARPKKGKSTFLSNIAKYLSFEADPSNIVPILYVDTEMTFDQWRDRIVASMTGIPERKLKHGGYSQEEYQKILTAVDIVEKGKLFHEYMPGYTVDKLTALYKKYKLKHGIGLMIFDYIKEPDSNSVERNRKEYQILGDVTTKLKDLAGSLNIPCLTAVQINREGSVADSDRIVRYADTIMEWMTKTEEEMEIKGDAGGQYKLVVRETRRGGMTPPEGIGYLFHKTTLSIKEAEGPDQVIDYGDKVYNHGDSEDAVK
jgi:replicative DNA helicase